MLRALQGSGEPQARRLILLMSRSSSRQPLFFRLTLDDRLLLASQRLWALRLAPNGNNHIALSRLAGQLLEVEAYIKHYTG